MLSLKQLKAKAKQLGLKVRDYRKEPIEDKYRYKLNSVYCKTVVELNSAISTQVRLRKKGEMIRKLDGHRPKYGYKTVPRKK